MRYQVRKKQQNSKSCLVCGLQNDSGLHAAFYELDNGELLATFTPGEQHQSYPGRLHGGISSTMLDETIGRALMITQPDQFGVTVEISVRFKKPVPLAEELRVLARITSDSKRFYEGTGEIILADGTVAVEAHGKYLKMALARIAEYDEDEARNWQVVANGADPEFFEI